MRNLIGLTKLSKFVCVQHLEKSFIESGPDHFCLCPDAVLQLLLPVIEHNKSAIWF